MGRPWENIPTTSGEEPAAATPPARSNWQGNFSAPSTSKNPWDKAPSVLSSSSYGTGSTDPNKGYEPYTYLKSIPSQVSAEQIDGLHPQFASRLAGFTQDAVQLFPKFQFSAGYDKTGKRHKAPKSWHYVGQAADFVPDWNFSNSPEDVEKLTALANKHGLSLLNEWVGGGQNSGPSSHLHIALPQNLPAGNKEFVSQTGRTRTAKQIEEFARGLAVQNQVDPDVVVNLLRTATNFSPDHAGQDGTFGLAKLPRSIIEQHLPKGSTFQDYLKDESLQVRVAVSRLAALVRPDLQGSGDYGTALSRYQGLPENTKDVGVEKTRSAFAANVLGVSSDARPEKGGIAPYNYDVQKTKEGQETGTIYSVPRQMAKNVVEGTAQTAKDALYGSYQAASNPAYVKSGGLFGDSPLQTQPQRIMQSFLPQMASSSAVRPDGTIDDKHWAVDAIKGQIGEITVHIPGLISDSMRASNSYWKWKEDYKSGEWNDPSAWGRWALLGGVDFAASLPAMVFATETFIPKIGGMIGGAANAAVRAAGGTRAGAAIVSSAEGLVNRLADTWLGQFVARSAVGMEVGGGKPIQYAAQAAWKEQVENSTLGYLIEKGLFKSVVPWTAYEGFSAMNREYQRQKNAGISDSEAWHSAWAAGRQNAASTFVLMTAFPALGAGPLALFRGAVAKGGTAVADLIGNMENKAIFGDNGPAVAKILKTTWDYTPGKNIMTAAVKSASAKMDEAGKGWMSALVRSSADILAGMQHVVSNETAHVAAMDALGQTREYLAKVRSGYETGIETAKATADRYQTQIARLEAYENSLPTRDKSGTVANYLRQEAKRDLAQKMINDGKNEFNVLLVDAKGKRTPAGEVVHKSFTDATNEIARLEALSVSTPVGAKPPSESGYWVNQLLAVRRNLGGNGASGVGLRDKLAEALKNPFLSDPTVGVNLNVLRFSERNIEAIHNAYEKSLSDGKLPDHLAAIKSAPFFTGPLTRAEEEEFHLLQARLLDRAEKAMPGSADASYVPMLQKELQREVETALVNVVPGVLEQNRQVATAENLISALSNMSSRNRRGSSITEALKEATEILQDFQKSIVGTPAVTETTKNVTKVIEPRGLGAIDFGRRNLEQILEGAAPEEVATYGSVKPAAVDKTKDIKGYINALLDIRTKDFPNGIPIGALAEKGLKYAIKDPASVKVTEQALSQMASAMISESVAPTLSMVRRQLENMAVDVIKGGVQGDKYTLIERFANYSMGVRDAMDVILNNRALHHDTVDKVFGASQYFANTMMGVEKAALRLSDDIEKEFVKRVSTVTGIRNSKDIPKEFGLEFAQAVQEGPEALAKFFNKDHTIGNWTGKGSELMPGMNLYFDVMVALERFKAQSPEMSSLYRANYFLQQHPRLLEWMQRGSDDAKRLATSISSERSRTIQSIRQAISGGEVAMQEVQKFSAAAGKQIDKWETFIYGFKKPEDRAKALGMNWNNSADVAKLNQLMRDILLGDPVVDPGQVLHNVVHSTFRADSVRNFLSQIRTMNGPEAIPLLINIAEGEWKNRFLHGNIPAASRNSALSKVNHFSQYERLDGIPGFGGYLGGNDKAEWMIHPQVANLVRKYLVTEKNQLSGFWSSIQPLWRSLCLIGSPFNYLYSLMSNYTTLVGWNVAKAYGFVPLGEKIAKEDASILMLRAVGAGLQPASLLRNAAIISEDFRLSGKNSPDIKKALADAYGTETLFSKVMEKTGGVMENYRFLNPVAWLEGADGFLNKVGLFNSLSHAQIGAWTYYTGQIMRNHGADLLKETGGRYGAALALAEKHAAAHVNRLAGVLPQHMMSDTMRNTLYGIALAPQYASAKWDSLVEAADDLIRVSGGRSRFAWTPSETLAKMNKAQLSSFLLGGAINSLIYSNALSYYINGHSTFDNPEGHKFDVHVGNGTYISNPMFGMFRGLLKGSGALVMDGDVGKSLGFFMGQLHPMFSTAYEMVYNKDPMTGSPVLPSSAWSVEWWKAASRLAAQRTFNIGDMGYRDGIAPPGRGWLGTQIGTPMTGKEWALQILGTNPTKSMPLEIYLSNKINTGMAYAKSQMQEQIRARIQLAGQFAPDSKEALDAYRDIIKLATEDGIPIGNPELTSFFKEQLSKNGNYVLQDPESVMDAIDSALNPYQTAFNRTPQALRPLLYKMIEEHTHRQILGFLESRMDKVNPADVMAERLRRMNGYEIPVSSDALKYTHMSPRYGRTGGFSPEVSPFTPDTSTLKAPSNPLRPMAPLVTPRSRKIKPLNIK